MKKISRLLMIFVIIALLISSPVFGATIHLETLEQDFSTASNINYSETELKQIRNIHSQVIEKKMIKLNKNGTVIVNDDARTLGIEQYIFDKYLESIKNINDIILLGVAKFNEKFELKVITMDEISNTIYLRDQEIKSTETNNRFDTPIDEIVTQRTLPTLYAYSKARSNKNIIKNYMSTMLIYNPTGAYVATVGYWVGKVRSNGAWDYKRVSGYSPWYKEWRAVQRYATSTKTTEWFGNYNYGFTGRYLFSLSILYAGGNAANWGVDSAQDKADIKQGYNESSGI